MKYNIQDKNISKHDDYKIKDKNYFLLADKIESEQKELFISSSHVSSNPEYEKMHLKMEHNQQKYVQEHFPEDKQPVPKKQNLKNDAQDKSKQVAAGKHNKEESDNSKSELFLAHGDQILNSLHFTGEAIPDKAATSDSKISDKQELVNKIETYCEKLLVSHPDLSSQDEIRLQLKQDILPQTEVRLKMDADGHLHLDLVSKDSVVIGLLTQGHGELLHNLEQRLPSGIKIRLLYDSSQTDSQGDSQRRSRQRRDLYEEWKNQD